MPFLSIERSADVLTRRRTQRFSLSTQKRRDCRLGKKRRLVLLLAWETLLPTIGFLPVTWHTRAMTKPLDVRKLYEMAGMPKQQGADILIYGLLHCSWPA